MKLAIGGSQLESKREAVREASNGKARIVVDVKWRVNEHAERRGETSECGGGAWPDDNSERL